MKIYKNGFNTLPMQVEENMKNIELIASIVKDAYKCSLTLLSSDISVAISDTNADSETIDGWLIDQDANVFKITGGDGTNLLLEFYVNLKGPQGEEGPEGPSGDPTTLIDDSDIFLNKTWSSNKINSKIDLISDKGIYYTLVQPTLDGGDYILNVSDLGNNNINTWQKYGDLIIYIDSNDNPTELWKCVGLNGTHDVMVVEKICDYAKGKQLYKHNINFGANPWLHIEITNDSDVPFTYDALKDYLYDNGFTYAGNTSIAGGTLKKWYTLTGTNGSQIYIGIYYNTLTGNLVALHSGSYVEITYTPTIDNDVIVPL